jgi:hypothetical protein
VADIAWSDVTDLQANLSTVAAGAQMIILAYVNDDLNPAAFGGEDSATFVLARAYLAAHLGELTRRNGTSGNVSSETYGRTSVSISYGASDDGLKLTSWGSAYAELLLASPLRMGLTSGSC